MTAAPEHVEGSAEERTRAEALSYAGLSLATSSVLVAFKVGVGMISGSHALLANALYSINDILSSIAVMVSLKLYHRRPSATYPYGFGKAEFIAIGLVSLTIAIGVFFMFFFSVVDILNGVEGPPHFMALSMAAVSMVVSWSLYRKAHPLAARLQSPAMYTSAEHSHADAHGSLAAIIGIGGAVLGFHLLDRLIAVYETLHLIALSGTLLAKSAKGLMDTALPEEDLDLVESACLQVDGVERVAHVWSRWQGRRAWVDVAVAVRPELDVGQAHRITGRVKSAIAAVLGPSVAANVRFQGPAFAHEAPPAGGSPRD